MPRGDLMQRVRCAAGGCCKQSRSYAMTRPIDVMGKAKGNQLWRKLNCAAKHLFHSQNAFAESKNELSAFCVTRVLARRRLLSGGSFISQREWEKSKLINYENGARGDANALHSAASLRPLAFLLVLSLAGIYFSLTEPCAQGDYRFSALCCFCLMILSEKIPSLMECGRRDIHKQCFFSDAISSLIEESWLGQHGKAFYSIRDNINGNLYKLRSFLCVHFPLAHHILVACMQII